MWVILERERERDFHDPNQIQPAMLTAGRARAQANTLQQLHCFAISSFTENRLSGKKRSLKKKKPKVYIYRSFTLKTHQMWD